MNTARELDDIMLICQARYTQCQQEFAKLVAEENHLRAELARLDEMSRIIKTPEAQIADMRAIGADVIWQGWLGRSKTTLNMKLAQVLAIKEHHLKEVRHAYGKVLVVQEMQAAAHTKARKKVSDTALDQAIDMSIIR